MCPREIRWQDPPPADHTPSGRPRPAPPALRSVPLPLHSASLTSLQSWRLPGLLLLFGTSDDHDRLGTRRSSSAGSARRAVLRHRAPRTEGWHKATPQTTPTARRSAPPPAPSGGGQCRAIGPGRRDRQVSLRPVLGEWAISSIAEQMWRQPLRREATPSKRGRPRSRTPGRTRGTFCSDHREQRISPVGRARNDYFRRNSFRSFSLTR